MATVEEIIGRYPVLFHMAELNSWPSILQHGLLSTSALLDRFEIQGVERAAIETEWRPNSVRIEHEVYGAAVIRDQRPMPPRTLAPLLEGMEPSDWYRLLNRKSFFWATEDRLFRLLDAGPYRNRVHDVLKVDTRELLERHVDRITLATFNTGVSSFGPKFKRGAETFLSIPDYPLGTTFDDVVEVVADYHVPHVAEFTLAVEQWKGKSFQREVWRR